MGTTNSHVHGIIHSSAACAGGVGAGLAQLPGADMPIIAGLQSAMIVAIAHEHGVSLTQTAAADLILVFGGSMFGRAISQCLVGWWPGWGNALNSATATSITEAIGWACHEYFEKKAA